MRPVEDIETILAEVFPEVAEPISIEEARAARDLGIARGDAAATEAWTHEADGFLYHYLMTNSSMFCDDLWDAGMPVPPGDMRKIGGVYKRAFLAGLMEKSGETRPSVRNNMGHKPVWTSLIYEEER